jgi:hypothetical protein
LNKLPISAFVVAKNEGHLLTKTLSALTFCSEIIVLDMGSTDKTKEIVNSFGAIYKFIESEDYVEIALKKYNQIANNEWILISDPDEYTNPNLVNDIINNFQSYYKNHKIGIIYAPIIYFFKKHKLKGTRWGGVKYRQYLFNINAVEFTGLVHQGIKTKLGYSDFYIPFCGNNYIEHYWATSIISLYKKHKRYLKNEGESKYRKGERITLLKVFLTPFSTFLSSFITLKGYADYLIGFLLSIFNAWYQFNVNYNLYKYQKKNK